MQILFESTEHICKAIGLLSGQFSCITLWIPRDHNEDIVSMPEDLYFVRNVECQLWSVGYIRVLKRTRLRMQPGESPILMVM